MYDLTIFLNVAYQTTVGWFAQDNKPQTMVLKAQKEI